jgi:hypothetical protein
VLAAILTFEEKPMSGSHDKKLLAPCDKLSTQLIQQTKKATTEEAKYQPPSEYVEDFFYQLTLILLDGKE